MANYNTTSNIWSKAFIIVLLIQAVGEFVLGGTILVNFPLALETGFGITYSSDLDILGVALGLYLLLLTSLLGISAFWTAKRNYAGAVIGMIVGIFLVTFGVSTFLKFGDINGILIDSVRGLITLFLAYKVGNQIRSV